MRDYLASKSAIAQKDLVYPEDNFVSSDLYADAGSPLVRARLKNEQTKRERGVCHVVYR